MPTLRPTVAIEKSLKRPDAPVILVGVSMIDATGVDGLLPGEPLRQEDALDRLHRQERLGDVQPDAPAIQSGIEVRLFAIAFVGLLCATVIGFVWEIRPLKPDLPDRGYDEALETQISSSSASLLSKCADDGRRSDGVSKEGSGRLGLSAIASHAAESPEGFTPGE